MRYKTFNNSGIYEHPWVNDDFPNLKEQMYLI